jgi:transcriptional regulator with XRE-family HTH domain
MHYREAFNQTLKKFGIQAKVLAQKSGVQERQISQFRNGKDLMAETLFNLIAALPSDAKIYYFSLLNGESMLDTVDLRSLIGSMSIERKSEVLNLIANSLVENQTKTESASLVQAV